MRVVDCHVQLQTRTYFEAHLARTDPPSAERDGEGYVLLSRDGRSERIPRCVFDAELQLEELEEQGVDAVVSTTGPFTVDHLPRRQATELAMHLNEERAEIERRFPGRFHALAQLPMQDAQAAIETLEHAIRTLAMRGVAIGGDGIATPSVAPIFRRVAELGVPLFLEQASAGTVERVLEANPTLVVVHPGARDGLPCLAASAAKGPDRLLFASGYPFGSPAERLSELRCALAGEDLKAALSQNAVSLLGVG